MTSIFERKNQEVLSLRYDYGWTEQRIVEYLKLAPATIHRYLLHNSNTRLLHNNGNIQHLEGDCLEILPRGRLQHDQYLPLGLTLPYQNRYAEWEAILSIVSETSWWSGYNI